MIHMFRAGVGVASKEIGVGRRARMWEQRSRVWRPSDFGAYYCRREYTMTMTRRVEIHSGI
jgi:hypothetical protein